MEEGPDTEVGTDSAYGNKVSTVTTTLSTREEEGVTTESTDRWHLNDGTADLAERGLEIVNAGWNVSVSNLSGSSKRRRQTSKEEADVSANILEGYFVNISSPDQLFDLFM